MKDNGLVQYFRDHKDVDGFLKTKECRFRQYRGDDEDEGFHFIETPTQRYFRKEVFKDECDAEVLLSQIYKNAGFNTAIYVPAVDKKRRDVVLSNDLRTPTSIEAYQLHRKIQYQNPDHKFCECIPQNGEYEFVLSNYLTNNAISQIVKMNAFDMASKNPDRHFGNYIYDNPNNQNKYDDIVLFDYGQSGYFYAAYTANLVSESELLFPNLFSDGGEKSFQEMVWQLKNNQVVKGVVSISELANQIGSMDILGTARDIEESIGYKVDPGYVDFLSFSYEKTAKELDK